MHPAFSVVFLTTLIGAAQGLYLAAFGLETLARAGLLEPPGDRFQIVAGLVALLLMALGLGASFAHLGRPERAWRSASQWRTSWLSREVLLLPAAMGFTLAWALLHGFESTGFSPLEVWAVGALGALFMLALFVSTGMIYACIKFIEEWATPLTVVNFTLFGCASGATLAALLASLVAPALAGPMATAALTLTAIALLTRGAALARNARLRHKSSLQSAIGVRHTLIKQRSMGMMGGSFNTREFFHGRGRTLFTLIRLGFLVAVFPGAAALLVLAREPDGLLATVLFAAAFAVQYAGLVAERWYFFAEARHPQNLYYQTVG